MELNLNTILFIDDHFENYLDLLEPTAKSSGYDIYAVGTVLEGLEFLSLYHKTIDAVILDLAFPKGEMQGIEALEKIKNAYPTIPVIMLTGKHSSNDIDIVIKCIKMGAYDYVGKHTLNAEYLFLTIKKAIEQAQMQNRLTILDTDEINKTLVIKPCDYGYFKFHATFGYRLIPIDRPEDEYLESQPGDVNSWHENFLKTIWLYKNTIQLNLKYYTENKRIKCCIVITVYAITKKALDDLVRNVRHDINSFFPILKSDITHSYFFEKIKDLDFLDKTNTVTKGYCYNVFYRSPIKAKNQGFIGFETELNKIKNIKNDNYPDEIISFEEPPFSVDNELLHALLNQDEYAEVDIQLIPRPLITKEIDLIWQGIKHPYSFNIENLTIEKQRNFSENLQRFINSNYKYAISVLLKSKSADWERHLKTGIINYCFGAHAAVHYDFRLPSKLNRFCTSKNGTENWLPFYCSIDNAIQTFHLPLFDF